MTVHECKVELHIITLLPKGIKVSPLFSSRTNCVPVCSILRIVWQPVCSTSRIASSLGIQTQRTSFASFRHDHSEGTSRICSTAVWNNQMVDISSGVSAHCQILWFRPNAGAQIQSKRKLLWNFGTFFSCNLGHTAILMCRLILSVLMKNSRIIFQNKHLSGATFRQKLTKQKKVVFNDKNADYFVRLNVFHFVSTKELLYF